MDATRPGRDQLSEASHSACMSSWNMDHSESWKSLEIDMEIDHSGTAHGSMDACALNVSEHPGECKQLKHDGKYQWQAIPT